MLAASAILLPHAVGQCLAAQAAPPVYGYKVVKAYPHDPEAYTQGLIYRDTFLYESTGRNGHSTLRKVKLETGEVLQQQRLDPKYFAEGLTDWNGRLIQLTWRSNLGFVLRRRHFQAREDIPLYGRGLGADS